MIDVWSLELDVLSLFLELWFGIYGLSFVLAWFWVMFITGFRFGFMFRFEVELDFGLGWIWVWLGLSLGVWFGFGFGFGFGLDWILDPGFGACVCVGIKVRGWVWI